MSPYAPARRATPDAAPASLPGAAAPGTAAPGTHPSAPIPPVTTRTEAV